MEHKCEQGQGYLPIRWELGYWWIGPVAALAYCPYCGEKLEGPGVKPPVLDLGGKRCDTCKFCKDGPPHSGYGECRAHPPTGSLSGHSAYTRVTGYWYCWEWEPREQLDPPDEMVEVDRRELERLEVMAKELTDLVAYGPASSSVEGVAAAVTAMLIAATEQKGPR